jgi:hypothetical protein
MRPATLRRLLLGILVLATWLAIPREAEAYPWMMRHEYVACTTCHTDPSGGGLLTAYGRAQSAILLSSRLGLPKNEEEPGKYKDFLFGAVPLPEQVDAQAWGRYAYLYTSSGGNSDGRLMLMRADAGAHLRLGMFRASGMLGAATPESKPLSQEAWITSNTTGWNLVSREHWLGASLADDAVLVRAGRLNLPFGLRMVEHTAWVRSETRTDINQNQQHGIAASYTGEKIRGELMAIAGNFQTRPDAYRDRGYAVMAEYAIGPVAAMGLSSSVVHADADFGVRKPVFRHGHGLFARFVPVKPLVLMLEGDAIVRSPKGDNPSLDVAGLLQADFEIIQGVHVVGTGELLTVSRADQTRIGGWLSAWWFLFAHMDARVDLIHRTAGDAPGSTALLFQLHGWL